MDKAHTMMHGARLSLGFWELAVDTAVYIYNRTPSRTIGWRMLHELWSVGHTLDVSYFRVFGCKAFVHVPEDKRRKLDPQAIKMVLVRYEPSSKGYWLWNRSTRAIVLSRDMTFDKPSFPFKADSMPPAPALEPLVPEGPVTISVPVCEVDASMCPQTPENTVPTCENTIYFTPPLQPAVPAPPSRPR